MHPRDCATPARVDQANVDDVEEAAASRLALSTLMSCSALLGCRPVAAQSGAWVLEH